MRVTPLVQQSRVPPCSKVSFAQQPWTELSSARLRSTAQRGRGSLFGLLDRWSRWEEVERSSDFTYRLRRAHFARQSVIVLKPSSSQPPVRRVQHRQHARCLGTLADFRAPRHQRHLSAVPRRHAHEHERVIECLDHPAAF